IGECPEGAIELEEREAEPYDEVKTIERIAMTGKNTVLAHLRHLRDHNEKEYVKQAIDYLNNQNKFTELINEFQMETNHHEEGGSFCGCPGSKTMDLRNNEAVSENTNVNVESQLRQWPIQLHLVSPVAPYFRNADVVIAADCVAFSYGNFHNDFLKGKSLVIACPKLDSNKEIYVEKIKLMVSDAKVNTLTVLLMEVPCCGGLLQMTKQGVDQSGRKVPIKAITIGISGKVLAEEWV
ncbi:MAG: 4Fe-4S ferredoxin, partial [Bacteroidota bacterium]